MSPTYSRMPSARCAAGAELVMTVSLLGHAASDLLGHYVRLAVLALEHAIGFSVAGAGIAGGIEMQRAAQAIGNVRQVDQSRGDGAFFDGRVQVRVLAAAHGVDEVGPVIARQVGGRGTRPRRLLAAEPTGVLAGVFARHREVPLGAV